MSRGRGSRADYRVRNGRNLSFVTRTVIGWPAGPRIAAGAPLMENVNADGSPMRSLTSDFVSTSRLSPAPSSLASTGAPLTVACTQHGPVVAIARWSEAGGAAAVPDV